MSNKENNNMTSLKMAEEKGIKNFVEKYHCKITVLRLDFNEDLYIKYPYGHASPCGRLTVGQEFISICRWDPPEGFCVWAWRDLIPVIQSYHKGRIIFQCNVVLTGLDPLYLN